VCVRWPRRCINSGRVAPAMAAQVAPRAAQVVKVEPRDACAFAGFGPPRAELYATERAPLRAGKYESVRRRPDVVRKMVGQEWHQFGGDVDRAPAVGLRCFEHHLAARQFYDLLLHMDLSVQEVDAGPSQPRQLPESQRAPRREDHKRVIFAGRWHRRWPARSPAGQWAAQALIPYHRP
jgi:hypothetical protein